MRGCLGLLVFLFLFLPVAFGTLLALSVSSWIADRAFYQQALDNPALYEVLLTTEIPITLTTNLPGQAQALDMGYYRALGLGLREVVTADYLRQQVTGVVDQFFALFEGQNTRILIDLQPIKAALRGEKGDVFARVMADNLPACGTDQPQPRTVQGVGLPICIPANTSREDMAQQVKQAIPTFIELTPNQLNLTGDLRADDWQPATTLKQALSGGLIVMIGFTLGLWLLVGLVGGTTARGILMWLGGSLFVPASMVLLIGLAINTGTTSGVIRDLATNAQYTGISATTEFRAAVGDIAVNTVSRVANGFLTVGGGASVFAVAVFVLGLLAPARRRKAKY